MFSNKNQNKRLKSWQIDLEFLRNVFVFQQGVLATQERKIVSSCEYQTLDSAP